MGTWWKDVERRVATLLGGERIPVTGRGKMPDVVTGRLAVEVKARNRIPRWLEQAIHQALLGSIGWREKQGEWLYPIVWLHRKNRFWGEDLVIMQAQHFVELLEGLWKRDSDTDG